MSGMNSGSFIDLFSGCGGLSLGFLQAGFKCALAIDNDPKAVHCYNFNLERKYEASAVAEDLSKFTTRRDVSLFLRRMGVGSCDILMGGPPCQSFSVVGRNKVRRLISDREDMEERLTSRAEKRTRLFEAYALFVETLAPRWFMFENVPAIQSHQAFSAILDRFANLRDTKSRRIRYSTRCAVHMASDYGLPQDRRRFILVGVREDVAGDGWREPERESCVSVAEALADLPPVGHGHKSRLISYTSVPRSPYQRHMRSGVNGDFRNLIYDHVCRWHNPDDVRLFSAMRPGARFADPDVQAAIRRINPRHKLIKYATDKYKDKLHKLDPDRPAWTVTAHLQKDCYKFIHFEQPRTITVREAARLQGFPDWFRFDGISMVGSFGLIGNAVPPVMARSFAESFAAADNHLAG